MTSLMILVLALGLMVVNHFASRTLPWREMRRIQLICIVKGKIQLLIHSFPRDY